MDAAFDWVPAAIDDPELRRLVCRRALVVPDSPPARPRYVWSWVRLVESAGLVKTGPNVETMKGRWIAGIDRIVAHTTPRRLVAANDSARHLRTGTERAPIRARGARENLNRAGVSRTGQNRLPGARHRLKVGWLSRASSSCTKQPSSTM